MNRYINPAADLNYGSGDDLQLDWAGVEGVRALPLSAAQLGIWFAQQIDSCPFAYNIGEYIEIEGSIDPALFAQTIKDMAPLPIKNLLRGNSKSHTSLRPQLPRAVPELAKVAATEFSQPAANKND